MTKTPANNRRSIHAQEFQFAEMLQMEELYIHLNPIGDEGAMAIAQGLHNITNEVRLDHCGITRSGYEDLLEAYQDSLNVSCLSPIYRIPIMKYME